MSLKILFIGLDVDDKNFHGYALLEGEEKGNSFKSKASLAELFMAIDKVKPDGAI